jgi:hypothetical protein
MTAQDKYTGKWCLFKVEAYWLRMPTIHLNPEATAYNPKLKFAFHGSIFFITITNDINRVVKLYSITNNVGRIYCDLVFV